MADDIASARCVLIVEDEILVRMFAVDVLEDAGFQVEQAAGGAEALAKLRSAARTPSAVIIDLGLPDRPGDEVAAEMRQAHAALPILIASGRSERELRDRFASDPGVAILAKPYTEPMLLEALRKLGVSQPS
ncbi:MAG TPA: response regulator [Povalibacter sp.]|nr:response regulator [Povalibacter sp.]